jgi:hypothetical protein
MASVLELAGGRLAASDTALSEAVAAERRLPPNERRAGFQAVTSWYASTLPLPYPDSMLARARREVQAYRIASAGRGAVFEDEMGLGKPIRLEPLRQYTLGMLSVRLRDTAAAGVAASALHRMASSASATTLVRDLDRGLRASVAWTGGHADAALQLLDSLECSDSQGDIALTPFVTRANERFLYAELLGSTGHEREAQRWLASLGDGSVTEVPLRALSQLRQGEIAEQLGDRDEAAEHYTRFLALWRDADPVLQPMVAHARQRLGVVTTVRR